MSSKTTALTSDDNRVHNPPKLVTSITLKLFYSGALKNWAEVVLKIEEIDRKGKGIHVSIGYFVYKNRDSAAQEYI